MDENNWRELARLIAIRLYNSERNILTANLIVDFLINPNFKRSETISRVLDNDKNEIKIGDLFINNDHIVTSGISFDEVFKYLPLRYGVYAEAFFSKYKISLVSVLFFSVELLKIAFREVKDFKVYKYASKQDYANREFLANPPESLVDSVYMGFMNVADIKKELAVQIDEMNVAFTKIAQKHNIKSKLREFQIPQISHFAKFLELFAFDLDKVSSKLRIREFPFFIEDNKIAVVDKNFFQYIPQKLHFLLTQTKSFSSKKGDVFEKISQDLLKIVQYGKLEPNINYEDFSSGKLCELDGLLNLRRSTWFVECKSRNVSSKALQGDFNKITDDLKRGITKGIEQAERAIANKKNPKISCFGVKPRIGIMIVTEGIFPNESHLRLVGLTKGTIDEVLHPKYSKYPLITFNYFELKKILSQPDAHLFEDFLIWRTQENMPIFCMDECDYWAFYCDNYRSNPDMKEAFKRAQENVILTTYISSRFNNKEYLENIAKNNTG